MSSLKGRAAIVLVHSVELQTQLVEGTASSSPSKRAQLRTYDARPFNRAEAHAQPCVRS